MTIHRDGKVHEQLYEKGVPATPLSVIGESPDTCTEITFKPDLSIFTNVTDFEFEQIDTRLKETAFLNAGLEIVIADERGEEPHISTHLYEGGIGEFVTQINNHRQVLHKDVKTFFFGAQRSTTSGAKWTQDASFESKAHQSFG